MEEVSSSACDPTSNLLHLLNTSQSPLNHTEQLDDLELRRTGAEYYTAVFVLVALFLGTLVTNGIVLTALLFCDKRRLIKESPLDVLILGMTVADLGLLIPVGSSLYDVALDHTAASQDECRCFFLCCWDYGMQTLTVLHLLAVNAQRYKGIRDSFYSPGNPTSRQQAAAALVVCWLLGASVFVSFLTVLDTAKYSYWDLTCVIAEETYACRHEVILAIFLALTVSSVVVVLLVTVALMRTVRRLQNLPRSALGTVEASSTQNVEMEELIPSEGSQPQPGPSRDPPKERRRGRRTTRAMQDILAGVCPCKTRTMGDKGTQTHDDASTIQPNSEKSTVRLWVFLTSIAVVAVVCYVPQVCLTVVRWWRRSDLRPHRYIVLASRVLFYSVGILNPVQNALHRKQVVSSLFRCNCRPCHLLLRMCSLFRKSEDD